MAASGPGGPIDPVFGRADLAGWRRDAVKGILVTARRRYVVEKWGHAAAVEIDRALDGEAAELFHGSVIPSAWYPFPALAEIDRAIVNGPMRGEVRLMKEFGSTIA